jgi:hypothetical protein
MNGHVFQCYGEATEKNQYARTVEELEVYIGTHVKRNATDLKKMVRTMADTELERPTDLSDKCGQTDTAIWKAEVDMYVKQREAYRENKCALFSIIWSQCSKAMQAKIKSASNYETLHDDNDSLLLLAEIKGILYKFESQKNIYVALDMAKSFFYSSRQGQHETNAAYMTRFKDSTAVIEHYGGSIGDDEALVREEIKRLPSPVTEEQITACTAIAKEKSHAIAFLRRADPVRYTTLTTDLENQFTRGNDQYPTTVTDTYNMLVNYKKPSSSQPRGGRDIPSPGTRTVTEPPQGELAFALTAAPDLSTIQCYNCQVMGHYATTCTAPPRTRAEGPATGMELLQHAECDERDEDDEDDDIDFCFVQKQRNYGRAISPTWILLDSESTTNIFANKRFLRNIRPCDAETGLRLYSNGGHQDTHLVGDLPGFGTVWYNKKSLANILSLASVRKICRVKMDSWEEAALIVHKKNGEKLQFVESGAGLFLRRSH